MSTTKTKQQWALVSVPLLDAWTDFMLSRQASNFTINTLRYYKFTAGMFLKWIESQGVTRPDEVTARHVRQYLALLAERGKKDGTLHGHARAIKTLMRFWYAENYTPNLIKFDMPKRFKKRLPMLTAEQLQQILKVCNVRDKALILFLADSGLRRAEAVKLNWCDVDMQSGLVRVVQGKGRKDRSAVAGATTRRALLKYRRTVADHTDNAPIFQTAHGGRFSHNGFLKIFTRLTKQTGIKVTPHALRRTFTILALRAGMSLLHLQHLGGWESLAMVDHYAQMVDEDLLQEHKAHSPIDNLDRLK